LGWLLAIASALNAGKVVPACDYYVSTGYDFVIEHRAGSSSKRARLVADWLIAAMENELATVKPVLDSLTVVEHNSGAMRHPPN